jgi:hypothetical protein
MKLDHLGHADGHWLRALVATPAEAYDAALALQNKGRGSAVCRVLRGGKMRTLAGLFDEAAAALQFPPYFGENWDALDECLADLQWLPADGYVLTILDGVRLLDRESAGARQTFWRTLERAAQEWGQPAGGPAPRPAKVFRVIVQCAPEEEGRLREQLPGLLSPPGADHRR